MTYEILHKLDCSDSGCGDIRLTYQEICLLLDYEYRLHGKDQIGHLRFYDVVAFRFRDELHSAGFALDSYDSLVKITNSEWIDQLRSYEPAEVEQVSEKNHYAILISNTGYLEVIADVATVEAAPDGGSPAQAKR